jgi:hypothetical protein
MLLCHHHIMQQALNTAFFIERRNDYINGYLCPQGLLPSHIRVKKF